MLIADSEEELTLVFDLAIYTAKEGRSQAIDRYASMAQLPSGTDELLMLDAMRPRAVLDLADRTPPRYRRSDRRRRTASKRCLAGRRRLGSERTERHVFRRPPL
jgi:hypothetical protein